MDTEELTQVRRMRRRTPGPRRAPLPEHDRPLDVRDAHLREHPARGRRPPDAHQLLPPPGRVLVAVDLAAEPGDRRRPLARRRSSVCAECARQCCEQADAGQGDSPQRTPPPWVDCLVVDRGGRESSNEQAPTRCGYAFRGG